MPFGIRGQLLVPVAAIALVIAGVSAAMATHAVRRERARLLNAIADIESTLSRSYIPLTEGVLLQLQGLTGVEFCLYRPGRESISTLPRTPGLTDVDKGRASDVIDSEIGRRFDWDGQSYFLRPLRSASAPDDARLVALYPVTRWDDSVAASIRPAVVFGLSGLVISTGFSLLLGRLYVRKIESLVMQTQRVAGGDFSPMPLPASADEFRDLAASVNSMAARLRAALLAVREGERWQLLGQLSSGLAHQLRNDTAGAKLALQQYLREAPPGEREPVDVAIRQLGLTEMHLQQFLRLGRAENPEKFAVEIGDLIRSAMETLSPRCRHFGIEITVTASETTQQINADREAMVQVLVNLIDNAITACGPGGRIEIASSSLGETACMIEILDTGPGPPAEIAQALFEPFVTGQRDGIGLGLAIAHRIITDHGGRVQWDRVEQQTRFRVTLPLHLG